MRHFRIVLIPTAVALLACGSANGQDQSADVETVADVDAESVNSVPVYGDQRAHEAIRPCIGAGYIPYSYPAIGSCPCGDDLCFNPHRYYCCGKQYKKAWFRKWSGSHLGKRSMLDDYWCPCIYPTTVPRPYLRTVKLTNEQPLPLEPPPLPPAFDTSQEPG